MLLSIVIESVVSVAASYFHFSSVKESLSCGSCKMTNCVVMACVLMEMDAERCPPVLFCDTSTDIGVSPFPMLG